MLSDVNIVRPNALPAKRSLNFSSPSSQKLVKSNRNNDQITLSQTIQPLPSSQEPFTPNLPLENTPQIVTKDNITTSEVLEEIASFTHIPDHLNSLSDVSGPNKRTVNDLFGDIGDIDFDDIQLPSKKQKTEEEEDLDLINKILEGRRLRQLLAEPTGKLQVNSELVYNKEDNLSLDIPR